MSGDRVFYNGREMAAGWPARIEAAQEIPYYLIGGNAYPRVRYGDEEGRPDAEPCHDCGVLLGQYHVELVCDMEECPRCGDQVIGCDCPYDGDEEAEASSNASLTEDLPPLAWRVVYDKIRRQIEGYTVFLETRRNGFVHCDGPASQVKDEDVVGLAVAWLHEGVPTWETEEPAKRLAEALSKSLGTKLPLQLSRSLESFIGYYVQIRP